jgi:hypothetical protein
MSAAFGMEKANIKIPVYYVLLTARYIQQLLVNCVDYLALNIGMNMTSIEKDARAITDQIFRGVLYCFYYYYYFIIHQSIITGIPQAQIYYHYQDTLQQNKKSLV